jgi:hypothetical protein
MRGSSRTPARMRLTLPGDILTLVTGRVKYWLHSLGPGSGPDIKIPQLSLVRPAWVLRPEADFQLIVEAYFP